MISADSASFIPYKITVTNSNGGEILKISDALRTKHLTLVYLASTQSTYTITKTSSSTFTLDSLSATKAYTAITAASSNSTDVVFNNLAPGYYAIRTFLLTGSYTFGSDDYPCPSYLPTFPDYDQVYQACANITFATSTTDSGEDDSIRRRNIALIVVFSVLGVVALAILIIFLVKKNGATAVAGSATPATDAVMVEDISRNNLP